jgi:hypothetical protein
MTSFGNLSSASSSQPFDLSSLDDLVIGESLASGSSEGRTEGAAEALKTGSNIGIMKGWEIGVEMGFMVGIASEVIKNIDGWLMEERTKERVKKLCDRIVRDGEGFESVAKGEVDRARLSLQPAGGEEEDADEPAEDDRKAGGVGLLDVLQGTRARFKVVGKVRLTSCVHSRP